MAGAAAAGRAAHPDGADGGGGGGGRGRGGGRPPVAAARRGRRRPVCPRPLSVCPTLFPGAGKVPSLGCQLAPSSLPCPV